MLNFNLPPMWGMGLLFLFLVTYSPGGQHVSLYSLSLEGKTFLVFFSQMGHPSRFYTGSPQLCLPSLSRPKTMSPIPSWDPWALYPDLKPPQALSSQYTVALNSLSTSDLWDSWFTSLRNASTRPCSPSSTVSMCLQQGGSGSLLHQLQ